MSSSRLHLSSPQPLLYEQVSAAVHDLKNPICSILNLVEMLLDTPFARLEETHFRETLALIQELTRHLNQLTHEMLPSTRPASALPAMSTIRAAKLIHEAVWFWQPLAAARSISLQISEPPAELALVCDRAAICRVFSNLIGNAVQHSEPGTSIYLSAERQGDQVLFKVTDQGCGIAPAYLEQVFERYWQSEPGKSGGKGLGLAIARDIVTGHGGNIWAENHSSGRGCIFCFNLPILATRKPEVFDKLAVFSPPPPHR